MDIFPIVIPQASCISCDTSKMYVRDVKNKRDLFTRVLGKHTAEFPKDQQDALSAKGARLSLKSYRTVGYSE